MKLTDKQALKRFQERCKLISETTRFAPKDETFEQKQNRIQHLLSDYQRFINYYFPHWCTVPSASFHIKAASIIQKHKQLIAVFEWARGHAKSTHFDLLIPLWLKAQKDLKVMVLVGKSEKNAITLLSDIQAELENNHLYIHDFGEQMLYGNWEEGRFATTDGCGFFALGRGQSPRGLRYHQYRPDYIVLDDVDDDELCRNPDRVAKLYDWVTKALFFSMDMGRGRFILVGNRISHNSLLARMCEINGVIHHKVNALNNKGEPSWPSKYTKKEITELIQKLGYRVAQQELFNNPISEGNIFKREWIIYQKADFRSIESIISYCDPSFKDTSTSDYKAIVTIGKSKKQFFVLDIFLRQCSLSEMIKYWYDLSQKLPSSVPVQYYMEGGFVQDFILQEIDNEGLNRGYILPVRLDTRKKPDKYARIESISPIFERHWIYIDERIQNLPDTKTFIEQLLAFQKGSHQHDDGPDALEGALYLFQKHYQLPHYQPIMAFRTSKKF